MELELPFAALQPVGGGDLQVIIGGFNDAIAEARVGRPDVQILRGKVAEKFGAEGEHDRGLGRKPGGISVWGLRHAIGNEGSATRRGQEQKG
jgi:hypothetical protein